VTFAERMESAAAPPELSAQGAGLGIGVVGCGAIVEAAHLPAYANAGLKVVAVADTNLARARDLQDKFNVPSAYNSAAELLEDPRVDVVDIAVDPQHQHDIAVAAIASGRHVMCQKPMAEDIESAEELVALAAKRGVVLAVNQQMRWEPLVRGIHDLIIGGDVGQVIDVFIDVDVRTDWDGWPWMVVKPRLELFYHSIHHLDSIRFLLGDPESVLASLDKCPGQTAAGETRSLVHLRCPGGATATVRASHHNWSDEPRAIIRVRGTQGYVDGELGLLYDYPRGRADAIQFRSRGNKEAELHTFKRSWVPDAFESAMTDLLRAASAHKRPSSSGSDNLQTLRVVLAAYESEASGSRIHLRPREL